MVNWEKVKVAVIGIMMLSIGLLQMGSHIHVTADNIGDKTMSASVMYVPDLCYSPTVHDFGYVIEGETHQTTFDIWNCGTDTLTWSLGIVHTWISPSPTSGSSTGEHDTVTVTIDTSGLSPGDYTGFVSISANDGGGLRYFNVNFTVHRPPHTPTTPSGPSSGEVDTYLAYTTSTTDPDGHQVRYGWDANNDLIVDHWSSSYYPSGAPHTVNIKFGSTGTYHIRVKAEDKHGALSSFSAAKTVTITGANTAPLPPATPSGPISGEPNSSYTYSTSTIDPNDDQVKFYFDWGDGTGNWTSLVASEAPVSLAHAWQTDGIYPIRVKAQDEHGAESEWSNILNITISSNVPPNKPPRPSGPTSGRAGVSYTYSAYGIDTNEDQVYLVFDWADGTTSEWMGPYNSGDTISASHIWTTQGTYAIKVKAKDEHGLESIWSDPLAVSMPYERQTLWERIIEWILHLFEITIT
ncbi:MAG: PKD domain-containing protein [Thermoplasmatota archaeon]